MKETKEAAPEKSKSSARKRSSPRSQKKDTISGKRASARQFKEFLFGLPFGVYRTTPDGKIIEANPTLIEILGYENEEEIKNINVEDLYLKKADRTRLLKKLEASETISTEFALRRRDKKIVWVRDYPRAVYGSSGNIEFMDGILIDITKQKQAEEKLKTALEKLEKSNKERQKMIADLRGLSLRDDLTGLYNRRGFFTITNEYLKLADRRRSRMFLLFMDVDNLKRINDTLGHHKGDEALMRLADIINQTFRKSDIKGRMGGDEFAIFPIESSMAGAKTAVKRLRKNLEAFNQKNRDNFELSVSLGIASYDPEHPSTIDGLLVRADKLLYEEKRQKSTRSID